MKLCKCGCGKEDKKGELVEKKILKVDLENGDTLFNMFDYLCSKVNWGRTALDNEAICCMNTLFIELRKDDRIIKT